MNDVLNIITDEDGFPITKIHGLRMLNPKIFTKLPLSSADSCNAAINCGAKNRFKGLIPNRTNLKATVIASNVEMHNSCATWQGLK